MIASFLCWWFLKDYFKKNSVETAILPKTPQKKPLEKYTIENLSRADIKPGRLKILEKINEEDEFSSYLFEFEFNPTIDGLLTKKTTGQINLPTGSTADGQVRQVSQNEKLPVVIMFRGYIDQKLYKTGDGTRNASNFFAQQGFITIAPDFLGYGESDEEAANIFESRFQTYVTALSLLKTLEKFSENSNPASAPDQLTNSLINYSTIFLWGHSNGGQIALTALEITGKNYPTTLWAPVSKPFPYSVLHYTDESEDKGKLIRKELSKFEGDYDVELYSLANYFDRINTPLQIHQGLADDAVPASWSNDLVSRLKDLGKVVTHYKYPETDHNMRPSWDTVIKRDLEFFKNNQH